MSAPGPPRPARASPTRKAPRFTTHLKPVRDPSVSQQSSVRFPPGLGEGLKRWKRFSADVARTRWTLLVAILLLPTGAAGSGSFQVEGGADLPAGSQFAFAPAAAFLQDATRAEGFRLEAERVTLHVFEQRKVHVEGQNVLELGRVLPEGDPRQPPRHLDRVEITFRDASEADGYLGVYPVEGASAAFEARERAHVEAQKGRRLDPFADSGDVGGKDAAPLSNEPDYEMTLRTPHAWIDAPGSLRYVGPGLVKVNGPDLHLRHANGTDDVLPTGRERVSPTEVVLRWVVIEMAAGAFEADAASPWALAGASVTAHWEGEALFRTSSGEMKADEGRYVASGGAVRLSGRFDALFAPDDASGRLGTRMTLSGHVDETTLQLASASLGHRLGGDGSPLGPVVLLAGAVVGVGLVGTRAWLARRPRAPPAAPVPAEPRPAEDAWAVEDCMAAATAAADDEDWPLAILWLERVRAMAPTSSRTCADLAHALSQMGRPQDALRMYGEASRLAYDGEADFNGAVVALESGRPPEDVEPWVERALARTPAYVLDVESDPAFRALRGRPRFDRALADAWARLDEDDLPGP